MAAFAINTKYVDLPELKQKLHLNKGDTGHFSIESELQYLPIRKNNHFLFIRPDKDELIFTNDGVITTQATIIKLPTPTDQITKARRKNLPPPKDRYRHTFNYKIEKPLEKNNYLNDLKYSLRVVYNFYKPESHFSQQFREINSEDYKTIVNGWIYTVRTAFGKVVNALPKQNRLEFMLQAMENFGTIDFVKVPLLEGIDFLNDYVNRRIISRGKLLVATDKLITGNLKPHLDPKQVGFFDEISGNEKNIHTQAIIFRKLLSLQNKTSLKDYLSQSIQSVPEIETHFDTMFKRETWPIDLRI